MRTEEEIRQYRNAIKTLIKEEIPEMKKAGFPQKMITPVYTLHDALTWALGETVSDSKGLGIGYDDLVQEALQRSASYQAKNDEEFEDAMKKIMGDDCENL